MKKSVITSSIMYKAHSLTKKMVKEDSSLNYRTQLGINIRHYLNIEKINREFRLLQISAYRWIKQRINHNNNIHSEEMHNLISDLNLELNIKRYYWGGAMNAWQVSHDLANRYPKNIKRYA